MNNLRYPKVLLILNALLLCSLLLHSFIFFFINTYYNPYRFFHIPLDNAQLHHIYTAGRSIAELISSICGKIYLIGHFIVLFSQKRKVPAPYICIIYFLAQIIILLFCTLPFALVDSLSFGDYLFPIWNIIIGLVIFWIITLFGAFHQKLRPQKNMDIR